MKTLEIVGPSKAGKKMIAGQLLYQLNGVDLKSFGVLQTGGKTKYEQILPTFRELAKTPSFYTPSFEVVIVDSRLEHKPADGIVLVLSPDTINDDFSVPAGKLTRCPLVCILNKMDSFSGGENAFRDFKRSVLEKLKSLGIDTDKTLLVPVSGLTGENVVVNSENELWASLGGEKLTLVGCLDSILKLQSNQA